MSNFDYVASLATELDISEGSIRQWAKALKIPTFKHDGKRCFTSEMGDVIRQVKSLRDQGLSLNDIAATIKHTLAEAGGETTDEHAVATDRNGNLNEMLGAIRQQFEDAIDQRDQALRKELFGDLLTEHKALMHDNAELRAQHGELQKLLPEQTETLQAKDEELLRAQKRIVELEKELGMCQEELATEKKLADELDQDLLKSRAEAKQLKEQKQIIEDDLFAVRKELKACGEVNVKNGKKNQEMLDKLENSEAKLEEVKAKSAKIEEDLRSEITDLRNQLEAEKAKSGWSKLFKK